MNEKTIALELALLLPDIEDDRDQCLTHLLDALRDRKGISHAHLEREKDPVQLCIHFDPNYVSLDGVRRTARQVGAELTERYRHVRIPFEGMDRADEAPVLRRELERIPGMLHADVNYAAGLAFVAYDSQALEPEGIVRAMRGFNVRPVDWPPGAEVEEREEQVPEEGPFLPRLVRERWRLLLVGLSGLLLAAGWAGETFFGMSGSTALIFFLLAYLTGGYDITAHALPGLVRGKFDTDVLMLAAAVGAAVLGRWAEGAFLLFLFSLGHAGEHYALGRARRAVNALGKMMPDTARVREGGKVVERPVSDLQVGDRVIVRPGDRLPVDGEVEQGESGVDQSPITGESVPVPKAPGDEVFAGTVNQDAVLEVSVTRLAEDNTLNRIMQMVAEAQSQQSPTQRFTERFTAWFVPGVLILVLLVVTVPPLVGWMPLRDSFYRAMLLLVAASPCALALSTPAAVLAGIAQAARSGVLIKGGMHLENLGALQVMAFDKTGTLTEGEFRVTDVHPLNGKNATELLRVAGAVEQGSGHPLALAVVQAAKEEGLDLPAAGGLVNISGRGVRGEFEGQPVLIGSLNLFRERDGGRVNEELLRVVDGYEDEDKTTMVVQHGGQILGVLALADTPRPHVKETLQSLLAQGVKKLVMLTGDNQDVARNIARAVGVTDVRAELLPEDKVEAVKALREEYGDIAMVGDGVNDAPALAASTVGIAMGGAGTAVALETADVALMADDLGQLPFAVGLSRRSRSIIRQNLIVALGTIIVLLLTSVTGLIELSWAVVLHEGSSVLVVLNALRLLGFRLD